MPFSCIGNSCSQLSSGCADCSRSRPSPSKKRSPCISACGRRSPGNRGGQGTPASIEMLCSSHPAADAFCQQNVPGPIRATRRSRSHVVNLKNVHGPIRSSSALIGHVMTTEKHCLNTSGFHLSPKSHSVSPKNVHGSIPEPRPGRVTLPETGTASACCVFCPVQWDSALR